MASIALSSGETVLVDDGDHGLVSAYAWYAKRGPNGRTYAKTNRRKPDGGRSGVVMHRIIMGEPVGLQVDHRNHDGLDNRRENLRVATNSQNAGNARPQGGSSAHKGVGWHKGRLKWQAYGSLDGRRVHLGSYAEERDAALAYDAHAVATYGEFALTNLRGDEHA